MKANFDDHAINYDAYFSNSLIGRAQRERFHYFLNKHGVLLFYNVNKNPIITNSSLFLEVNLLI